MENQNQVYGEGIQVEFGIAHYCEVISLTKEVADCGSYIKYASQYLFKLAEIEAMVKYLGVKHGL